MKTTVVSESMRSNILGRQARTLLLVIVLTCAACVAMASSILITDFYTPDILKIDLGTGASSVFATLPIDSGDYPGGIAYNAVDGKVYVGTWKGKIWSFNADGTGATPFFSTPANTYYSTSMCVGNGVVYGIDAVRRKVVKYDSAGNETEYSVQMGDETRYQQMIMGPDGNLYIAAYDTSSVLRVLPDGTYETWLSDQNFIEGVAFSSGGNLSVMRQQLVWSWYNKIWNFSPTGEFVDYRLTFDAYHATNLIYGPEDAHLYQLGLGGLGRYGFLIDCITSDNTKIVMYERLDGLFLDMTMLPDPAASSITGKVILSDYAVDVTAVPVNVELNGTPYTTLNLEADGKFTIPGVPDGTYDVRAKASHWLAKAVLGVNVAGATDIGEVTLINGDVDGDNEVTSTDLSILGLALGSVPEDPAWDATADLDGDGEITSTDLSILGLALGIVGD